MSLNPSSVSLKKKKELYAKALAQDLRAKGYTKIKYIEEVEGRDIVVNDTIDLETLPEEDIQTIDILYRTLASLDIPQVSGFDKGEPSGTAIFEGIEIIVEVSV